MLFRSSQRPQVQKPDGLTSPKIVADQDFSLGDKSEKDGVGRQVTTVTVQPDGTIAGMSAQSPATAVPNAESRPQVEMRVAPDSDLAVANNALQAVPMPATGGAVLAAGWFEN